MKYINKKSIVNRDFKLDIFLISDNGIYSFEEILYFNNNIEKEKTFGITDDENKANYIFNVLCENEVFPCHLHYIVDSLLN